MDKSHNSSSVPAKARGPFIECYYVTLRGLEYLRTQRVLEMCGGSRAKAAKVLGAERAILRRYLNE